MKLQIFLFFPVYKNNKNRKIEKFDKSIYSNISFTKILKLDLVLVNGNYLNSI